MMSRLAQLFIDICLRGGGKVELVALRDELRAFDKALDNSANLYQRQTIAKIAQIQKIAGKRYQMAELDRATFQSSRFQDMAMADRSATVAEERAQLARQTAYSRADLDAARSAEGAELQREKARQAQTQQRADVVKRTDYAAEDLALAATYDSKKLQRDMTRADQLAERAAVTKRAHYADADLELAKTPQGAELQRNRAKVDQTSERAAVTKQIAYSKAQLDLTNSMEGKELSRARIQRDRIDKQRMEVENWRRMVAEQGVVGASLQKVQDKLGGISQLTSTLSLAGAAGGALSLFGAVGSASPETLNTLTGSFRLLGAEIGTVFLPAVLDVARWVQQMSQRFRELSPETKALIGQWGKWAIVASTVAGGFLIISSAVTRAGLAIVSLSKNMTALMANPAFLKLALIAAAVGGVAYALYSFSQASQANTNSIARSENDLEVIRQQNMRRQPVTQSQFEQAFADPRLREAYLQAPPAQRQAILDAQIRATQRQIAANAPAEQAAPVNVARAQRIPQPENPILQTSENAFVQAHNWLQRVANWNPFVSDEARNRFDRQLNITRPMQTRDMAVDQARAPIARGNELRVALATLQGIKANGIQGVAGGPQRDMLYSSNFQSQFMGIEEAWKRIQQASASGGSLEAQLLQIQLDNLPNLKHLSAIDTNTGNTVTAVRDIRVGTA